MFTNGYYGKSRIRVDTWLQWFLAALLKAVERARTTLDRVLAKTTFWQWASAIPMNGRPIQALNRRLDGFKGKLTSSKWAAIAQRSQDTALRDITALLHHEVLQKAAGGGRSTHYEIHQLRGYEKRP